MARLIFRNSAKQLPWLGKVGWRVEDWLLQLYWFWLKRFDAEQASTRGYRLFRWLGPHLGKNRHVESNLKIAFPGRHEHQYASLAREVWGNTGRVLAEYPFLQTLVDINPGSHTEIEMDASVKSIVESRQPAVYVTPHLANWEIAAATLARLAIPITTIYSPLSNPFIDSRIQSIRESLGMKFVPKKNAMRQLVRAIRQGRSVGMLPDQRYDQGEAVPFFGIEALTTASPAWLAVKMNCPLIPVEIERTGPARFRAMFHAPVDTFANEKDVRERQLKTTRQVNACFERWIRKHPEHWHCIKRRWPIEAYTKRLTAGEAGSAPGIFATGRWKGTV